MSGSTIYNHRSLQPTGPPAGQGPPNPAQSQLRLNDSFDAIRHEFETVTTDLNVLRVQRDELEAKVATQVSELNKIHSALYDLEAQHKQVRLQYDEEVHRLRQELHNARQGVNPHPPVVGPGSHGPPSSASIGLPPGPPPGPSSSGPGGLPPQGYSDPYYRERDRERERDKEREREIRDRERERDRMEREREAEARDRERDRERALDRDRERSRTESRTAGGSSMDAADYTKRGLGPPPSRDADKRFKQERIKTDRGDQFSPSLGPGLTPKLPPLPSASGPSSGPVGAPGGPGIPPPAGPTHSPYPPSGPAAPEPPAPAAPPSHGGALVPLGPGGAPPGASTSGPGAPSQSQNAFPDDLDIHSIPNELKKEGSDWFAIFNPNTKRVMDVTLVHTLMHESVVCCVRFSQDGKYLATGCNRTAQIYDTKTGAKTCVLVDEQAAKSGDLYIRSVCFSPDGKFLATGAEDKQIRIWDIAKKRIRTIFDGHQQEIYSLDFSSDGRLIVSGSGDKTARIWDMVDGTSKVLTINDPDSLNNDAGVTSVAISPDGRYVAAGSLDTVVRIWDVATAQLVERLRGHRDSVYSVAFTPDGKGLVSGSLDKTLKYWDVSALIKGRKETNGTSGPGQGALVKSDKPSQCTMNFTGHKDYVLSVAVSHDGQWVVSGSKDRGVQFWDSRNAVVQCMLQGHKNSVISIDLSRSGSMLATGSGDWQARIWSYSNMSLS